MKPAIYNTEIEQGSTFDRAFTITSGDFVFTDYDSVRMKIRSTPGNVVVWDSEAETPGGSITIESDTVLRLIIDAATTAAFEFTNATYDIELVKDGDPIRVDKPLKGTIIVNKENTR